MYLIKMLITEDNETNGFTIGEDWYNRDSKYCPLHTQINNTKKLSEAIKFNTEKEAKNHMDKYFQKGFYEVVKK